MAGRRKNVLDVREMVRRFRKGESNRRIARDLNVSRITVKKYRKQMTESLLLEEKELATPKMVEEILQQSKSTEVRGPVSSLEPYRDYVKEKREKGVEMKALLNLLHERGYDGSYSSLRRFIRRLEPFQIEPTIRVETKPGEEAQVDFGYVGMLYDSQRERLRKAWIFVMTLCYSRHQYAEIVFDQKVETWVELHVSGFEWFGGVVSRVVLDNLKSGIVKAVLHDQEAQRSYRELAEHYDFLISPCRPYTPQHKGKVESGVRYAKRNAMAGREFANEIEANAHLRRWVLETAGVRDHGTTHEQPLVRFERERESLLPLPAKRYEIVTWKNIKLHADCHVVFDYAYYSAPHRLIGQQLWVRGLPKRVEICLDYDRIATHPRAVRKGQRLTIPDHLPPDKLAGLMPEPVRLRAQAEEIGSNTKEFIDQLLGEKPLDRLRGAQAVLKLQKRFGERRLEAACHRALRFDEIHYQTVKNILHKGLEQEPITAELKADPLPKTSLYTRTTADWS